MDASGAITSLAALPADIFGLLSCYLSWKSLNNLYNCGSNTIKRNLQYTVRTLNYNLVDNPPKKRPFKHSSKNPYNPDYDVCNMDNAIEYPFHLHLAIGLKVLKRLVIRDKGTQVAFFDPKEISLLPGSLVELKLSLNRPSLYNFYSGLPYLPDYFQNWPHLKVLELNDDCLGFPDYSFELGNFLHGLPDSLTSLRFFAFTLMNYRTEKVGFAEKIGFAALPSSLESLTVRNLDFDGSNAIEQIQALPRSLTDLRLHYFNQEKDYDYMPIDPVPFISANIQYLPSKLLTFEHCDTPFPESAFSLLPPTLTHLGCQIPAGTSSNLHFPHTLTSMKLLIPGGETENWNFLPKNLKSLSLIESIPIECVDKLPKNLIHLNLGIASIVYFETDSEEEEEEDPNADLWRRLRVEGPFPSSLITLTLRNAVSGRPSDLPILPPQLQHLKLEIRFRLDLTALKLPKSLTEFSCLRAIADDSLIYALPPCLTSLKVHKVRITGQCFRHPSSTYARGLSKSTQLDYSVASVNETTLTQFTEGDWNLFRPGCRFPQTIIDVKYLPLRYNGE